MVCVWSIAFLPEASNRSVSPSAVRFSMSLTTEHLWDQHRLVSTQTVIFCWLRKRTQTISTCSPLMTTAPRSDQLSFLPQDKLPLDLLSANATKCSFPTLLVERQTPERYLPMSSQTNTA